MNAVEEYLVMVLRYDSSLESIRETVGPCDEQINDHEKLGEELAQVRSKLTPEQRELVDKFQTRGLT